MYIPLYPKQDLDMLVIDLQHPASLQPVQLSPKKQSHCSLLKNYMSGCRVADKTPLHSPEASDLEE